MKQCDWLEADREWGLFVVGLVLVGVEIVCLSRCRNHASGSGIEIGVNVLNECFPCSTYG